MWNLSDFPLGSISELTSSTSYTHIELHTSINSIATRHILWLAGGTVLFVQLLEFSPIDWNLL